MGKNIVSALKLYKRLACACHNLNLVMDDIIEKHPSLEIQTLVECSKKLVQYFKQSGLNSKLSKTLKQDVRTRWNSRYIMLHNIFEVKEEVKSLLLAKNELSRIAILEITLLENLITFLKDFKEFSEKLSSDKEPTMHIYPLFF